VSCSTRRLGFGTARVTTSRTATRSEADIRRRYSPTALSAHPSFHAASMNPPVPYGTNPGKSFTYQIPTPGPSTIGRYDPFSPPRKLTAPPVPPDPTSTSPTASNAPRPGWLFLMATVCPEYLTCMLGLRFRSSPFFRIDQTVTAIVECPGSTYSRLVVYPK
jgi:hypothetical protein